MFSNRPIVVIWFGAWKLIKRVSYSLFAKINKRIDCWIDSLLPLIQFFYHICHRQLSRSIILIYFHTADTRTSLINYFKASFYVSYYEILILKYAFEKSIRAKNLVFQRCYNDVGLLQIKQLILLSSLHSNSFVHIFTSFAVGCCDFCLKAFTDIGFGKVL